MSYRYERISKKSLPAIANLYKDCFNLKVSTQDLEKKYNTDSFGESYTGFIAIDNNESVGAYYGVFPCSVKCNGEVLLASQSGDTMTGPNHRKKGLFSSLAKETYDLVGHLNIAFVFGFPNKNSLPGFERKLDWKFYGYMQHFNISNSVLFPFCEIASKFPMFKKTYRSLVRKKLEQYRVEEVSLNEIESGLNRDTLFYNYKLSKSKDTYLVRIEGFEFIIKTEPHLMIGDVSKFDKSQFNAFKLAVKLLAKLTYSKTTNIVLSKNHWLYDLLINEFESENSLPIGFYQIRQDLNYTTMAFSLVDYDTF